MEDIRIIGVTGPRIGVGFTEKNLRFHVWLDRAGNPEDILYKNPPLKIRSNDPGFFTTVKLDATNKTNAPKVESLMQAVRDGDLINRARKAYQEEEAAKRAEERTRAASLYRAALALLVETMTGKKLEPVSAIAGFHDFLTNASDEQIIEVGAAIHGAGV